MVECSYLPFLMHLTFTEAHIKMSENDAKSFFNHIWGLPRLTYCSFGICFAYENYFPNSTVVSISLRHLVIQYTFSSSILIRIWQHTPNLEHLSANFENSTNELEILSPILSITRLKILFAGSLDIVEHILQNIPNLHNLTFESYCLYINGYQWEEMINKYLPGLKRFRFKVRSLSCNYETKETQLNEIVDSFRSQFWINEHHKWFVRCQWYTSDQQHQHDYIDIFTLPYNFDNYTTYADCILVRSTYPYDDEYMTSNGVKCLYYDSKFFTSSILSDIRLPNIHYLSLIFPFNDQFLSLVSKFDRLTSLYISSTKNHDLDSIEQQLQFLLDRALRLHSLTFGIWSTANSQVPSMSLTSRSVRRLDLHGYTIDHDWRCFDDEQCIQLTRSPLGIQCETLLIKVKNRMNVLDLVNKMPSLQALNVRCDDDSWLDEDDTGLPRDDELVEWLRQKLPLTCTVARDTYLATDIRLWIR